MFFFHLNFECKALSYLNKIRKKKPQAYHAECHKSVLEMEKSHAEFHIGVENDAVQLFFKKISKTLQKVFWKCNQAFC